eukprot:7789230-Karenia_brevis.AAC.1
MLYGQLKTCNLKALRLQYGHWRRNNLRIHAIFPERRFPGQGRNCGSAMVVSGDRTKHTYLQPDVGEQWH